MIRTGGILLGSTFFPENFWSIVAAYLGGSALAVGLSFWVTAKIDGRATLVFAGMLAGALVAANQVVGLLVLGAAVGAVCGCVLNVVVWRWNRT